MSIEQFVEHLKENKIEDAIQSMQVELRTRVGSSITESRQSILENLGFALNEEKDEDDDMDDEKVEEAKFYYAIQHKTTNNVLQIVDDELDAEELKAELDNSKDYKIVKITQHTKDYFEKRQSRV